MCISTACLCFQGSVSVKTLAPRQLAMSPSTAGLQQRVLFSLCRQTFFWVCRVCRVCVLARLCSRRPRKNDYDTKSTVQSHHEKRRNEQGDPLLSKNSFTRLCITKSCALYDRLARGAHIGNTGTTSHHKEVGPRL